MGRGNESLIAKSGSHDQDGHHAQILQKPLENLLQNRLADFRETWYVAFGTPAHHSLLNDPRMTLTYFTTRPILETYAFTWEKA